MSIKDGTLCLVRLGEICVLDDAALGMYCTVIRVVPGGRYRNVHTGEKYFAKSTLYAVHIPNLPMEPGSRGHCLTESDLLPIEPEAYLIREETERKEVSV